MATSSASHPAGLYSPRAWPSWFGFAVLWLLVKLPYPWLLSISRLLAYPVKLCAVRRRRIAELNLQTCFPNITAEHKTQLVHDHFASTIMGLFEMAMAWWWPAKRLASLIHVEGKEHLEDALAQGNGALLLGSHFTCLEIIGRLFELKIQIPLSGMYRPHENPVLEYFFQRYRRRFFAHLIRRDDIRGFIKVLKNNQLIWYAPDQNYRKKGFIVAPFFGVPAPTYPGTSRIVKISGTPVIPIEYRRLPNGEGYLIKLYPPLESFPTGNEVEDATRVNHVFEQLIGNAPEQYFWVHRKFKIRGNGVIDIYRQHGID